jgi:GAF domain-containing protein/HAMP domain-containing protein
MMPDTRPSQPSQTDPEFLQHRRNALWISAVTLVILVFITGFIFTIVQQQDIADYTSGYLTSMLALAALASLYLSYRKMVGAIGILLVGMMLTAFTLPYLTPGQVIAPALASIIMVTTIATATLPTSRALRYGIAATVVGLIAVVADMFLPIGFGVQSAGTGNLPISAGLVAVYAFIVLRRYGSYNLRVKILVAFIFVAFVPLAILGTYNSLTSQNVLELQGRQKLADLAQSAEQQVDIYISNQLDTIRTEAQQPAITAYMEIPSYQRRGSPEEANASRTLNSFVRKDQVFIYSYALLDVSGNNVLDTVEDQIGRDESRYDYFTTPFNTGIPFVSNLVFEENDKTNIHFSAPIRNLSGDVVGILRAEYNADIFQTILRSLLVGHENQGQLLALVDMETYVRVAYTGERDALYKSFYNYGPVDMAALQNQGRLLSGTPDDAISTSAGIVRGIQNIEQIPFFSAPSQDLGGNALTTGVQLNTVKWIALSRQSEAILYQPIRDQNRTVVLIAIGLLLLAVLAALGAAQLISAPVLSLRGTAEKLATGDLAARATVNANDEIGELARTFNRMSEQLSQTLSGLEARVTERTGELETARRQSEERALDLETISDVARVISGEQKLDVLLPLIANLVTEKFGHYHTGIFLLDPNQQYAVLQAASSEGGKRMLNRGHRLEVGQTGIVGFVAQTGQPRIALDVDVDAAFFNNPDLPATRSEIALPLNVRGQTIGVLDVQSVEAGAFTKDDLNTLTVLADQVAIAIENARLFGQTEKALTEVQAVYRQYISQEWHGFASRNQNMGYRHTIQGGSKLDAEIQMPEIRAALEKGERPTTPSGSRNEASALTVPVKLRNQVIGVINVQAVKQGRDWSESEVDMVQAISERLALALENARLFEETARRAELERLSAELSGKIGSSIRLEAILQTTAQELSRALGGGTEVLVQIQPGNPDKPTDKLQAAK